MGTYLVYTGDGLLITQLLPLYLFLSLASRS